MMVARASCRGRRTGCMVVVFVEVFGTFGLTNSEIKKKTMYMPISRAPETHIGFNATEQQFRQTLSFLFAKPPSLKPQTCQQTLTAGSVRGGQASSVTGGSCTITRRQVRFTLSKV